MMVKTDISHILRSSQTVFTFKDIFLDSGETKPALLRRRLSYYTKKGDLYPIRRGLYAKDKNYDKYELATKIYTPSYVSFETALGAAGVTFQWYSQIFVASHQTTEIECDGQKFSYHKIKDDILTNHRGIESRAHYSIASVERAFLDVIYLHKEYHFDNLDPICWDKVYDILPIYGGNKRMAKMVKMYQKSYVA